jgi:CspA family cold shock protein
MSNQLQTATCQRCGTGFILTATYHDLLARQGVEEIVPALCPTCFVNRGPLPKKGGEVKWFSPHKQYGLIVSDEGEEVFFHQQQLLEEDGRAPHARQRVHFHVRYPVKGPEALNVELVEE